MLGIFASILILIFLFDRFDDEPAGRFTGTEYVISMALSSESKLR